MSTPVLVLSKCNRCYMRAAAFSNHHLTVPACNVLKLTRSVRLCRRADTTTKRESGRKAQLGNILAAKV